jgi:hypothetical protein
MGYTRTEKKEEAKRTANKLLIRSRVEYVVDSERVDQGLRLILRRVMGEPDEPQPLPRPGEDPCPVRRTR